MANCVGGGLKGTRTMKGKPAPSGWWIELAVWRLGWFPTRRLQKTKVKIFKRPIQTSKANLESKRRSSSKGSPNTNTFTTLGNYGSKKPCPLLKMNSTKNLKTETAWSKISAEDVRLQGKPTNTKPIASLRKPDRHKRRLKEAPFSGQPETGTQTQQK